MLQVARRISGWREEVRDEGYKVSSGMAGRGTYNRQAALTSAAVGFPAFCPPLRPRRALALKPCSSVPPLRKAERE